MPPFETCNLAIWSDLITCQKDDQGFMTMSSCQVFAVVLDRGTFR